METKPDHWEAFFEKNNSTVKGLTGTTSNVTQEPVTSIKLGHMPFVLLMA